MIQFFNNTVCIILVIIITILFLKTLISAEHFFNEGTSSVASTAPPKPVYYGIYNDNFENLLNRLVNDREFVDSINKLYKKEYNESEIKELVLKNKDILIKTNDIKGELDSVPDKFEYILNTYKDLNNKYLNQKKNLEKLFVKNFDSTKTVSEFNLDNLKLKKKLKDFSDSVVRHQMQQNEYTGGKIMKNIVSNNELTLVLNKSVDRNDVQISLGLDRNSNDVPNIYYIAVNNNCLQSNFKGDFSAKPCLPNLEGQFFVIYEVKNNDMYNKYIKISGNYETHHLIDVLDVSIEYPFFVICPFNIPGYAVSEENKKLFIRPIRNDKHQRFNNVRTSEFCEI